MPYKKSHEKTSPFFLVILLVLSFSLFVIQVRACIVRNKPRSYKDNRMTKRPSQQKQSVHKKQNADIIQPPLENAQAYYKRGLAWRKKKNRKLAIQDFSKAISLNPNHAGAWFQRGNLYLFEENYDQALHNLNKAIELNPNRSNSYNDRGNAYHAKGNIEKALLDYNKAIKLNPKTIFAYHNRGNIWRDKGYYGKAASDYSTALKYRKAPLTYLFRGKALLKNGYYDQAITDFSMAIQKKATYASVYENRGDAWRYKDKYENALSDYKEAQQKSSKYHTYNIEKEHSKENAAVIRFFNSDSSNDQRILNIFKNHTGKLPEKFIPIDDDNFLIYLNNTHADQRGLYYLNTHIGNIDKILNGYVYMEDTWLDPNQKRIFLFRSHAIPKDLGWQSLDFVTLDTNSSGVESIRTGRLAYVEHYSPRGKCTDKSKSLGLTVKDLKYIFWQDRLFKSKDGTILLNINEQDCTQEKKIFNQKQFQWNNDNFVTASPFMENIKKP